jgi:hypothetical protein
MMATTTEPTAARYTDRLAGALCLFNSCRGRVAIAARSLHGFGESGALLVAPFDHVPLPVLQLLLGGMQLRISPGTRSGQQLLELPILAVLWRPESAFSRETKWRHVVTAEAHAAIAETLGAMLAPSVFVDAGPEVWAGWRLERPFDLTREADRAQAAQVALAARLGTDVETAKDLGAPLPLCGVIRNWNANPPDRIEIVVAEPTHTYTIDQVLNAEHSPEGGQS